MNLNLPLLPRCAVLGSGPRCTVRLLPMTPLQIFSDHNEVHPTHSAQSLCRPINHTQDPFVINRARSTYEGQALGPGREQGGPNLCVTGLTAAQRGEAMQSTRAALFLGTMTTFFLRVQCKTVLSYLAYVANLFYMHWDNAMHLSSCTCAGSFILYLSTAAVSMSSSWL